MSDTKTVTKNGGKMSELFTKKRILTAVFFGLAVPFSLIICSTLNVYFANAKELNFSVWDFLPLLILASLIIFLIIGAALIFTKGTLHNTVISLCSALMVAACVQYFITTLTFKGLPGDGNVAAPQEWWLVVDFAIWVAIFAAAIWFGILWNKADLGRSALSFLLIISLVMQTFMVVPNVINFVSAEDDTAESSGEGFLSTANMFELSTKDNIIVFVLDRFDVRYYNELVSQEPDFFKDFDGFTYYSDNISTYPRTYPAVTSMVTGVNTDFSGTKHLYFQKAFGESTFLSDLKENNYKTNLYISDYYSYDSIDVLEDKVANVSTSEEITIKSPVELAYRMFELGAYFWAPDMLKSQTISSNVINSFVEVAGDAPMYQLNDPAVYEAFSESGLYTQSKQNTFTFLHLRGCHGPFNMDENCQPVEEDWYQSRRQTVGCFKLISEYIAQMKELGIYEDATIIITGDHAALDSDKEVYTNENLTALLVKEKGQCGTALKTSDVPVSQDNFLATIVKSAGLKTDTNYGTAYADVEASDDTVRTHYFQTWNVHPDINYTYEITGSGKDFSNWEIVDEEEIGELYK